MRALTERQPDISYHPDFEKFQLRTERLKASRSSNEALPDGFPTQLSSPLVWEGRDFKHESSWTLSLNEAQLNEIHQALLKFKCMSIYVQCILGILTKRSLRSS